MNHFVRCCKRELSHVFQALNYDAQGQMYVELACLLPVVIVVALIGYNLARYVNICAEFDQIAQDAVICHGVSPPGESTQADTTRAIQTALQNSFGQDVEISVERSGRTHVTGEKTTFSVIPQLVSYECTLHFSPWPSSVSIAGVSYAAPRVLSHSTTLVIDPYKPGVVVLMHFVDMLDETGEVMVKAEVMGTPGKRLQGLLGTNKNTHPVVLVPCRSIHTIGMRYPIDVAFMNAKGKVLSSYRGVEPGRRLREKHASVVAERPAKSSPWFETGSTVLYRPHKTRKAAQAHASHI